MNDTAIINAVMYSAGKRSHSSPLQSGFQSGFCLRESITEENQTENQTVAERNAVKFAPRSSGSCSSTDERCSASS